MNISDYENLEQRATDYRNNGQVHEAIDIYDQLAAQMTLHGDTTRAAGMVHMMGVSYKVANRKQQSLDKLEQAKNMYEEAGDAVGAGRALRDIAITHSYSGDYGAAELILLQSIAQLKKTDNKEELAMTELQLGYNFLKKEDLVSANEWMTKGWEKIQDSDFWFYKMIAVMHRAELAFAEQEYKSAMELSEQAIDMIREQGKELQQKRRLAQLYGLLSLAKSARQEASAEEADLSHYYLSQLDEESQTYLKTKTMIKDLLA